MAWILRARRPWRRKGRVLLLAGLAACALWATPSQAGRAVVVPAADGVPVPTAARVRVQTLNVFGLPWPLAPDVAARCSRIARRIAADDVDVVALQEAWGPDASAPFAMPSHHRAASAGPARLIDSNGLLTLSRHPIRRAETRQFVAGCGIENVVRKGVLRTVLDLPDGELEVWNLHLQSGLADVRVRRAQIDELLRWLDEDGVAERATVVGDFNCAPGDDEFEHLDAGMRALGFARAACDRPTYDARHNALAIEEAPREIDHVYVRGTDGDLRTARVFDRPIDGMLPSDHFGVEASFAPRRRTAYSSRR